MKKLICMITALLLLPVLANAEMVSISELYDQAQELGRWEKRYKAHGRTIEVNIPVIVPDVEQFPVVKVNATRPFNDEQIAEIEGRFTFKGREGTYTIEEDEKGFEERAGDIIKLSLAPKMNSTDIFADRARVSISSNDHIRKISARMQEKGKEIPGAYHFGWELDGGIAYAEDNPMTLGEALDVVNRVFEQVYQEQEIEVMTAAVTINNRLREKKTGSILSECPIGSYSFQCLQTVFGISIGTAASTLLSLDDESYVSAGMNAVVLSSNVYSVMTMHPAQVQEVAYVDVPLSSLDEVIHTVELEIEAGHIRDVYSLELMYALYHDQNEKSVAWLYPTWVLHCLYEEDPGKELEENLYPGYQDDYIYNRYEYEILPVMAQSPELKAPKWRMAEEEKEKLDRYIVPTILTWEDINR